MALGPKGSRGSKCKHCFRLHLAAAPWETRALACCIVWIGDTSADCSVSWLLSQFNFRGWYQNGCHGHRGCSAKWRALFESVCGAVAASTSSFWTKQGSACEMQAQTCRSAKVQVMFSQEPDGQFVETLGMKAAASDAVLSGEACVVVLKFRS